jgi:para-nitrobenzyl esterase
MSKQAMSVVVRCRAGAVSGRHENGVAVFRGIPFGAPPVGKLRFHAPAPAEPWDGVREADVFGPPPPQILSAGGLCRRPRPPPARFGTTRATG